MSDTTTLTIEALFQRVESIFLRAGLNAVQSGALARVITAGERDACKSHGIYRIEGALRTVKAGKVKPDAIPEVAEDDGTAIVKVNANGGFANPAFELGLPRIDALRTDGKHVLIDGMRGEEELAVFRAAYGDTLVTVAVLASPETRLARVQQRGRVDDGDATAFQARDQRELGWSLAETIAAADETLKNDGSLDQLREDADALLERLESR